MSEKNEILVKNESDDSNFFYQDYNKDEQNDSSIFNDSLSELTTIPTPDGSSISVCLRTGNKILFCSGKFFCIENTTGQIDKKRENIGIVCTCHTCGVKIKGSLKVSSNFLSHLKIRHPDVYKQFLKQKQESSNSGTRVIKRSERSLSSHRSSPYPHNIVVGNFLQQQEQLRRNIIKFLITTNQSLTLVKDPNFLKLFEFMEFCVELQTPEYYEQFIKEECKYKQLELANYFHHSSVNVCLTSDNWTYGEYKYLALSCHWIDEQYQRQAIHLACISCHISEEKSLHELENDVWLRYGFQKDKIVNIVTENIRNYTKDFEEFGVRKNSLCVNPLELSEDCLLFKQMQEDLKLSTHSYETAHNIMQLDILTLNKIWSTGLMQLLDEKTKDLHLKCMKKCCIIWEAILNKQFKDNFESNLFASLVPPSFLSITSLYNSLKLLIQNKNQLSDICHFLKQPTITHNEIDYLEDLLDIFEPLHAAFEFLDKKENNFYGCFLPTLVTLKWKLTRLFNNNKLKYLQDVLAKLKEQLLIEFKPYYELNDTKSDAIIAAITYPPVKTRFLMGLQETVLRFNFQARNLLLKYGNLYHVVDNDHDVNVQQNNAQNSMDNVTTATGFFDFGDGTENVVEVSQLPNSLKLEIDAYLADTDDTLISLQKYPTIKRMFYRYNTCIPSPSSVLRLFPVYKILKNFIFRSIKNEQFQNLLFYQNHLLDEL
ncbi:uncharacterized protein ACRADG_009311 isoform 1-T1 [Cochliomyia hominivorax]